MPIVESLMANLVKRYGKERGERVYYAMEAEGTGPFAAGAKHRELHEEFAARRGLPPLKGKKKPAARKGRRAGSGRSKRGSTFKRKR